MPPVALEGVTVLADDVAGLAAFFEEALGLEVAVREEHYVAFVDHGVRLAVFRRDLMGANTDGHPSFAGPRGAQAFELNFACATVEEVESAYRRVIAHGGSAIAAPAATTWGHHTGFFADPEGNIHSLFAVVAT